MLSFFDLLMRLKWNLQMIVIIVINSSLVVLIKCIYAQHVFHIWLVLHAVCI